MCIETYGAIRDGRLPVSACFNQRGVWRNIEHRSACLLWLCIPTKNCTALSKHVSHDLSIKVRS